MASQLMRAGNSTVARQQKTMSLAIPSPTHGLMTVMEMWRKILRYTPPTTRERQTRSALFRVT